MSTCKPAVIRGAEALMVTGWLRDVLLADSAVRVVLDAIGYDALVAERAVLDAPVARPEESR